MSRFEDALYFAAEVHQGMHRKGSINPFILHPMEAAAIASSMTVDEDVLIAALLHDAIEDAGASAEQIRSRFGSRVTTLVLADTEPFDPVHSAADSWMDRKVALLEHLKDGASRDEKIVILADRLSNLRSIHSDMVAMGEETWAIFHEQKDPSVQGWFYGEVADLLSEFAGVPAYEEFRALVKSVFGAYHAE